MCAQSKALVGETRSHHTAHWWVPQPWVVGHTESERPEAQLVLACARTVIDESGVAKIKRLLQEDLDWSFVIDKAQRNCVMPLLASNLLHLCPGFVSESVSRQLSSFLASHARHNLFQAAALVDVVNLFSSHDVPVLPFKGPLLATTVYGNLSLRQFSDLDILVHQEDLTRAIELLVAAGYRRTEPESDSPRLSASELRRKDLVLTKQGGRVRVELHWRLSGAHFDFPLDSKKLWRQLDVAQLGGVPVNSLARNELLLYLSMHGSRHGWERLGWVCDVAELIRVNPDFDWDTLVTQAHLLGCERALMLALLLATQLLNADIPPSIKSKFEDDEALNLMAANAREWFFRRPGESLKLSDWYLYHLGMKERPRDKVRLHLHYYLRYLRLALTPNQKDHMLVLLPSSVSFLYYFLRPLRLAHETLLTPLVHLIRRH